VDLHTRHYGGHSLLDHARESHAAARRKSTDHAVYRGTQLAHDTFIHVRITREMLELSVLPNYPFFTDQFSAVF